MKELIKADLVRLRKDIFFFTACIIAAGFTYFFITNRFGINQTDDPVDFMELISIGVIAFLCVFSALFINAEYSDGVIRNKIIAGHSQVQIYFSHLITQCVAALAITASWLIGALIAKTPVGKDMFVSVACTVSFALCQAAIVTFVGMRLRKKPIAASIGVCLFYVGFSGSLVGNYLVNFVAGQDRTSQAIAGVIYNLSPVGQWMSATFIGSETLEENVMIAPVRIIVGLAVFAIVTFLGTLRLNKRELV